MKYLLTNIYLYELFHYESLKTSERIKTLLVTKNYKTSTKQITKSHYNVLFLSRDLKITALLQ